MQIGEGDDFMRAAFKSFYDYLGTLPDGEELRADMELVDAAAGALDRGENDPQVSGVAYRLAEIAENAPLYAEELVEVFSQVAEALALR